MVFMDFESGAESNEEQILDFRKAPGAADC